MTKKSQKTLEKADFLETARVLGANWRLLEVDAEKPDFHVQEGEASFGIEHRRVHCGSETAIPNRKAVSLMKRREGRRAKCLDSHRRRFAEDCDVPLRVVVRGNVDAETMRLLECQLRAEDWIARPIGQRKCLDGIPGLKAHAMRAFRHDWVDADVAGWVCRDGTSIVQAAIDEKALKLPSYRVSAGDDIRLLVVADHMFPSGKLDLPEGASLIGRGFTGIYFMARPRYVVEFSGQGQEFRRVQWRDGQVHPLR